MLQGDFILDIELLKYGFYRNCLSTLTLQNRLENVDWFAEISAILSNCFMGGKCTVVNACIITPTQQGRLLKTNIPFTQRVTVISYDHGQACKGIFGFICNGIEIFLSDTKFEVSINAWFRILGSGILF